MDRHQRQRYVQIVLGDDFGDDELKEMWADRFIDQPVPEASIEEIELEIFLEDMELWKAKRRASDGRITAIMDGIDICSVHSKPLPNWLSIASIDAFALLGRNPKEGKGTPLRSRLSKEVTLLKELQQAKLLHRIIRSWDFQRKHPKQSSDLMRVVYPDHVLMAAEQHAVNLRPLKGSQESAAEIVELWLLGTWAEGKHGSIIQSYKKAQKSLLADLSASGLTEVQEDFLAHDLEQIRPNTRDAIGCPLID